MPFGWDSKPKLDHLRYLHIAQLRDLLEDEETLLDTARGNKKFQDLQKQNEVKWASNHRLAEKNLSFQPYFTKNKLLLAEKYQLLGQVISSLRDKQRKLANLHGKKSLKATQQLLKQKVDHFTDKSESACQKFLEGNLKLLDFVESFGTTQKFYYKYLVQVEKIQNLSTKRHEKEREEILPTLRAYLTDIHSLNTVNVFYGLSPVLMLTGTFLHLMGHNHKSLLLPPLNGGGDICTNFTPINNPDHSPDALILWPQRPEHLPQYKKTKDCGPKPSP